MGAPSSQNLLRFPYAKSVDEIQDASLRKIAALKAKIIEREARIVRLRTEFNVSDADMIQLLSQAAQEAVSNLRTNATMSYTIGGGSNGGEVRIVGAGLVQNLLTERQLIEQERESVTKLEFVLRNLRPITRHATNSGAAYVIDQFDLSESDLEFLGF